MFIYLTVTVVVFFVTEFVLGGDLASAGTPLASLAALGSLPANPDSLRARRSAVARSLLAGNAHLIGSLLWVSLVRRPLDEEIGERLLPSFHGDRFGWWLGCGFGEFPVGGSFPPAISLDIATDPLNTTPPGQTVRIHKTVTGRWLFFAALATTKEAHSSQHPKTEKQKL